MVACFIGVIGITLGGHHDEKSLTEPEESGLKIVFGSIACFSAAFGMTGAAVANRKMHDVNVGILLTYMAILASTSMISFFTIRYITTGQTFL